MQFSVHGAAVHEPENLVYRIEERFSATGFLQRLDNFLDRFEQRRLESNDARRRRELGELQRAREELAQPFSRQPELEDLRANVREVMAELKKMQGDDNYVSVWTPRSAKTGDDAARARREVALRAGM